MKKKLIRDKIPDIIIQSGREFNGYTAQPDEIRVLVREKLQEELDEVLAAKTKEEITEELADLMEIAAKYAQINFIDWDTVLIKGMEKNVNKGMFQLNKVLITDEK